MTTWGGSWRQWAACRGVDPEPFFREGKGADHRSAKALCRSCGVRAECLAFALQSPEEFGIWGGLTPDQRTRLRNARRAPITSHGTPSGYHAHLRRREEACPACLSAWAEAVRAYRAEAAV